MTRREIVIKAKLKRMGYTLIRNTNAFSFCKWSWKNVEKNKEISEVTVEVFVDPNKRTYYASIFLEDFIASPKELEKYYVVYNRLRAEMTEAGLELKERNNETNTNKH